MFQKRKLLDEFFQFKRKEIFSFSSWFVEFNKINKFLKLLLLFRLVYFKLLA
jgi:hypothetical protein